MDRAAFLRRLRRLEAQTRQHTQQGKRFSNGRRVSECATEAPAQQPSQASPNVTQAKKRSRFGRALDEMKKKPGTHVTAFLLLHEATAVLPLFPLYYFFQWTDLSASFLGGPIAGTVGKTVVPGFVPSMGGRRVEDILTEWIDGIARTVARVGTRYGIMGFHKVQQLRGKEKELVEEEGTNALRQGMKGINAGIRGRISETVSGVSIRNVMDAVAAYAVVKALLPVRLALSIGATPWFANRILTPALNGIRRSKS